MPLLVATKLYFDQDCISNTIYDPLTKGLISKADLDHVEKI